MNITLSKMRPLRAALCAAVLTTALTALPAAQAADRALLIGVGEYENPINNLSGIDLDVSMMKDVARQLGFPESSIRVLMDEEATLRNVEETMSTWLVEGVRPNDRVLIYFSGHGTQVKDLDGDESDGADEALTMHDLKRVGNELRGVLIDDRFSELLGQIPSRQLMLVVDACHSGTGYRSFRGGMTGVSGGQPKFLQYSGMPTRSNTPFGGERTESGNNVVAMMAAADDQYSIATKRGSVFTLGIAQAVKGATSEGRAITPRQLIDEAAAFVRTELSRSPSSIFTPQLSGSPALQDKPLVLVNANTNRSRLEQFIAGQAELDVTANKQTFPIGDRSLKVSVDVPGEGYLNIVTVDPSDKAEILFPNRFDQNNRVVSGRLTVPTAQMPFDLQAQGPVGEHLVVAVWTQDPLNLYTDGMGERDASGNQLDGFAGLSEYGMSNVAALASQPGSSAGRLSLQVTD